MQFNIIGLALAYAVLNFSFQAGQEYAYREVMLGLKDSTSIQVLQSRIRKRQSEFDLKPLVRYMNDQMHHPPRKG
jgi:hypothetical protein